MTSANDRADTPRPSPEPYRYAYGHLYRYDVAARAYIHCYHRAGLRSARQAIKEYEAAEAAE